MQSDEGRSRPEGTIGEYLDQVVHQFVGRMPYGERQKVLDEVRDHLYSMVEESIEAGQSPEEAMAAALEEFGDPVDFAQDFLEGRAHAYAEPKRERFAFSGNTRAYLYFVFAGLLCINLNQATLLNWHLQGMTPLLVALTILCPIGAGVATGWSVGSRFLRAVRNATFLVTLIAFGVGLLLYPKIEGLVYAAVLAVSWLLIGSLAAAGGAYFQQTYASRLQLRRLKEKEQDRDSDKTDPEFCRIPKSLGEAL